MIESEIFLSCIKRKNLQYFPDDIDCLSYKKVIKENTLLNLSKTRYFYRQLKVQSKNGVFLNKKMRSKIWVFLPIENASSWCKRKLLLTELFQLIQRKGIYSEKDAAIAIKCVFLLLFFSGEEKMRKDSTHAWIAISLVQLLCKMLYLA